jgi:RimJ/RimL family protein N-acetyltransferase
MLLSGRGHLVQPRATDPPTIVSAPSVLLAVVVRWDEPSALARALRHVPREFSVVAPAEAEPVVASLVPERSRERATLFHLPPADAGRCATAATGRLLRKDEYRQLENLPPMLRGELRDACQYSPIASAFVDQRPVSFCYSGWETETHWDVSVDTLDGYRRRGLGAAASACLIHHFAQAGKTAVWGAVESNAASAALARKLGFSEVDRLIVVYPDDAHGTDSYHYDAIGV